MTKQKEMTGQALLLKHLFESIGGCGVLGRYIGASRQTPLTWIHGGGVPMNMVGVVARVLHVTPLALNYEGCSQIMGNAASWETVVTRVVKYENVRKKILRAKAPRTGDEVIRSYLDMQ